MNQGSYRPGKKAEKQPVKKVIKTTSGPQSELRFPVSWTWFMDEIMPDWVKNAYSPRESWKGKPFGISDSQFFMKGINELSELFTEERPRELPNYFQQPKFRSSYLLYFLPLQAAKFCALFQLHPGAMKAMLAHGRKQGVMRVLDLGAGPGTASIALLLWLQDMSLSDREELPPIEMDWVDTNRTIMEDGRKLAELIASQFPRLRGKLTIRTHTAPWWKAPELVAKETSLLLMGHVLNEAPIALLPPKVDSTRSKDPDDDDAHLPEPASRTSAPLTFRALVSLFRNMSGGGVLALEPAFKKSAQLLSLLRDGIFEHELVERKAQSIWGPCLHAERCPLATGRDWCHFSVPAEIPGRWFKGFSKGLGSERTWVKFSYVWFAGLGYPAIPAASHSRRVVSDPIHTKAGTDVLLCEPVTPNRYAVPKSSRVRRGDLIDIRKAKKPY